MDLCSICEKKNWQFMFAIGSFSDFVGENQAMRSQVWLPFFDSAYQVMTTRQMVSFECHGTNYIFTVNQAAVEGGEKSNYLERGMIPSETYFFFEASNASSIKVVFHFPHNMRVIVNGPEVLSKFVGETEKNVRDLFFDAENDQRTLGDQSELHVIIFDEIDVICKVNDGRLRTSGEASPRSTKKDWV
ncbi:hypothetical protein C5167_035559 [Papaver somniferum]|uniref:Vesicle-fusing ATPase n=1 Tax=Papaver somniferum TaxID=3469 RepID=A0A4Y7KHN1_PAPSO|nr:hypothetical protein C5167_035559 [Papaver somniferum]